MDIKIYDSMKRILNKKIEDEDELNQSDENGNELKSDVGNGERLDIDTDLSSIIGS